MDDTNAPVHSLAGIGKAYRLPLKNDFTRIGLVNSGEDFHQRRFAGAVFPHQRMDFAAPDRDADVV